MRLGHRVAFFVAGPRFEPATHGPPGISVAEDSKFYSLRAWQWEKRKGPILAHVSDAKGYGFASDHCVAILMSAPENREMSAPFGFFCIFPMG